MIHTERYGNGPRAVVALHGWSGDHTTFAPLLAQLPDDVTLYSMDLPGCGQSPAPNDWTMPAVAAQVIDAVQRCGTDTVTLVGNCSGALIGLVAAQRAPQRFRRLVLIDPFAYFPWYFRIFLKGEFGRRAYFSTFANPAGRWLTNLSLRSHRSDDTDMTASFASVNHEITYRYLLLLKEIASPEDFATFTMPIDIVHGARTFAAVKQSVEIWRGVWPHAHVHAIEGAGHLPIEEQPQMVADVAFANDTTIRNRQSNEELVCR